jgi:hypothetical protein
VIQTVPLADLWLPILLSAVFVFIASNIIHMVLGYHKGDYGKVPREGDVMDALRPFAIPPGDYMMPRADSMADMKSPEFKAKRAKGPVAMMTIMSSDFNMGVTLGTWFLYCVVVSIFGAYIGGRALPKGTDYLRVFQIVGCVTYMGYALALWQNSIWYKKSMGTLIRQNIDGLIYGLLTAGTFGWLWPK